VADFAVRRSRLGSGDVVRRSVAAVIVHGSASDSGFSETLDHRVLPAEEFAETLVNFFEGGRMKTYEFGAAPTLRADFKVESVLTDPTTVTLKVKDPDGNVDTYTWLGGTITKDGVGQFSKQVPTDDHGIWSYRWEATGTVRAAVERQFKIKRSMFS
jgi:hypothetical protein